MTTRDGRGGRVTHPEKTKLDFQMTLATGVRNKNNDFQVPQRCILK